jgi:tetratricopeptide (TPR) repeat protein
MSTMLLLVLSLASQLSGSIVWQGAPPEEWKLTLKQGDTVIEKTFSNNNFSVPDLQKGEYTLQITAGKQLLTLHALTIEFDSQNITIYFPKNIPLEQRIASMNTHYQNGMRNLQDGRYAQAIEQFKQALLYDTAQSAIWSSLALAYVGDNKLDDALSAGMTAIYLDATNASLRNNVGSTYVRMGRHKDAIPFFLKASELNPAGNGIFLSNAGACFYKIGDMQNAVKNYAQAVADPNAPNTSWYFYGSALMHTGNKTEAVRALEKYLSLEPNGVYAQNARRMIQQN